MLIVGQNVDLFRMGVVCPCTDLCVYHAVRADGFDLRVLLLADIEWVQEDKITLFTSDGLVQIGGNMVPRRVTASEVLNLVELELLSSLARHTKQQHVGPC